MVDIAKLNVGDKLISDANDICEIVCIDKTGSCFPGTQFAAISCKIVSGMDYSLSIRDSAGNGLFWLYPPFWKLLKSSVDLKEDSPSSKSNGGRCTGCSFFNEYQNGPYLCFSCKS